MDKKVWRVNLQVIEESYTGGLSTRIELAEDVIAAGHAALRKENQGSKKRSVVITSIECLGDVSF